MKTFIFILFIIVFYSCKKEPVTPVELDSSTSTFFVRQDSIYFVFVNKIGYRNDSINFGGGNVKYFQGICLKSGYHNIKTNKSYIQSTCYNRNYLGDQKFNLKDSIIHSVYPSYINSDYDYEIQLGWQDKTPSSTIFRIRRYVQKNSPLHDTIKTAGNKLIKFIWPNDTMPGSNFKKIYQYP